MKPKGILIPFVHSILGNKWRVCHLLFVLKSLNSQTQNWKYVSLYQSKYHPIILSTTRIQWSSHEWNCRYCCSHCNEQRRILSPLQQRQCPSTRHIQHEPRPIGKRLCLPQPSSIHDGRRKSRRGRANGHSLRAWDDVNGWTSPSPSFRACQSSRGSFYQPRFAAYEYGRSSNGPFATRGQWLFHAIAGVETKTNAKTKYLSLDVQLSAPRSISTLRWTSSNQSTGDQDHTSTWDQDQFRITAILGRLRELIKNKPSRRATAISSSNKSINQSSGCIALCQYESSLYIRPSFYPLHHYDLSGISRSTR